MTDMTVTDTTDTTNTSYYAIIDDIHDRMYAGAGPVEIAKLLHEAKKAFNGKNASSTVNTGDFDPRAILADAGPTPKFLAEVLSEYEKTAKS